MYIIDERLNKQVNLWFKFVCTVFIHCVWVKLVWILSGDNGMMEFML